jgi:hypothetical protein
MNHVNAIALNLVSLGLGSLRALSLGDVALIIAWTLILIVYVAGHALRFPTIRNALSSGTCRGRLHQRMIQLQPSPFDDELKTQPGIKPHEN